MTDLPFPKSAHHRGPRISVHLMVLNGASVVGRALRSVVSFADEICFVDTGSTDGTPDLIKRECDRLGLSSSGVAVSPTLRPDLYFADSPTSYRRRFDGEYTGLLLLRDWSAARNLGLSLCKGEYICKLDADDEAMVSAAEVRQVIWHLEVNHQLDAAALPYYVADPHEPGGYDRVELYTRFWRNAELARFGEVCHENVDHLRAPGGSNWLAVKSPDRHAGPDSAACFVDRRDSAGRGVRVPHRNFKVLLREYERLEAAGVAPSAHLCMYLAEEAISVDPRLSLEILEGNFRGVDLCCSDSAWARLIEGRCNDRLGRSPGTVYAAYAMAAELGSARARLLLALYCSPTSPERRSRLQDALRANEGLYYPQGATFREMRMAKELLGPGGYVP